MGESVLKILSLGAGVQSTTLALMAARGDIAPPDCAIFADTQWEPAAVYRHLDWLVGQLPFPVYRVTSGNIRSDIIAGQTTRMGRFSAVPWFLRMPDGKAGMGRRQCTAHYKLEPIRREVRRLLGVGPRQYVRPGAVEMWIGISSDEAHRAKPSRRRYIVNVHPFLDMRVSRGRCLSWLAERQYPRPPKSACVCCPFHSDDQWDELTPDERADANMVDGLLRDGGSARGIRGQQFMHRSLKPLADIDFAALVARGNRQADLFGNECEGMCGV